VAEGGEVFFQADQKLILRPALEDLGDEGAAGFQDLRREFVSGIGQHDDPQVVGRPVAGGVGGHVGEDNVGGATGSVGGTLDGDTDVGAGQSGSVVGTVTYATNERLS